MTTCVFDDLELYALGALADDRAGEVARHLTACASCRAAASELADLVAVLPDAVPPRDPPAGLEERILAAARQERRAGRTTLLLPGPVPGLRLAALAAVIVLLIGTDSSQALRLEAVQAERDEYAAIAQNIAHGGRTWYMAGVDQWKGVGGNLIQPASGAPAFVLFHDLGPLPDAQLYTLWLISADGKWSRGTGFRSDGHALQAVRVGLDLAGFERCALTVETSASGKREGPIVMQSRIAPPGP